MNISGSTTRIQEHLYGTPACKFKYIAECKSEYAMNLRAKGLTPNTTTVMIRGTTSTDPAPTAKRSRNRDIQGMVDKAGRDALDLLWAMAVVENDWAFRVSQSPALQSFVEGVVAYGKPYTLPSVYKVSHPLLAKLKTDTEALMQRSRTLGPRADARSPWTGGRT
ncbi:hypothetical protein CLOM_g20627 [Closterium sp. NIES-68]|nr:hypothetical protein CLOM_g20627 [Closterium sp. NIES-68]GJP66876.1 hypothetical protein CLOP_g23759 [Closterium sp. NIES-67]GJP69451.1 hypothetical protein CLOP_g463 [Closterium sp. NIES-67]